MEFNKITQNINKYIYIFLNFLANLPEHLIFLHPGSVVTNMARDFKALPKV